MKLTAGSRQWLPADFFNFSLVTGKKLNVAKSTCAERLVVARQFIVSEIASLNLHAVGDAATFGSFLPNIDASVAIIPAGDGRSAHRARMPPRPDGGVKSSLAETTVRGPSRRAPIEVGCTREVLANNLSLLEADPHIIGAAVLSHGDLDH